MPNGGGGKSGGVSERVWGRRRRRRCIYCCRRRRTFSTHKVAERKRIEDSSFPSCFRKVLRGAQQVSPPSSFDCITPHTRPRRRDVVTGGADSYIDSEERGGGGFRSASKDASSLSTTTCALSSTFVDKIFRLRKYLQDAKKTGEHDGLRRRTRISAAAFRTTQIPK